ncbi:TonB-dependent receptor [Gilliamella sp. ESL0254]|uniref:TonB-dependent receptor n=1 Tax=Gilliamella sp. ESL0254 TaxID=2705035 RepID=UPI0015804422|nr:TonB-dependent receptor [Gilliamella sp. ESL0254]NUF27254.1 TonB-dependent receptor [Gilliamella sp. ESL0254]
MKLNVIKLYRPTSYIAMLTLCFSADTFAEENRTSSHDTIIVTADRNEKSIWDSAVSVNAINRDDIEKQNGDSVAEVLRDIPGVEITDNSLAGRKQIMIRGEAPSRILMLIDGQEVTYHRSGHGSGAGVLIDMESVERIEVIKGPHSVLYGSQAIGGVVNFITRKGSKNGALLNGDVKVVYNQSTNGFTEMGTVNGTMDQIFDYRISGTHAQNNDRKAYQGKLHNTDFGNDSLSSWFGVNLDKHKFGLALDHYRLDTKTYFDKDNNAPSIKEFWVKLPKLQREKIGLFYDYNIDSNVLKKLHYDAYAQKMNREFRNHVVVSPRPMIKVNTNTATNDEQKTYGMTFQSDFIPHKNMKLITGAQYQQDNVDQNSHNSLVSKMPSPRASYTQHKYLANKWQQTSVSLFGQNDWAITDDISWNIGARQYWVESKLKNGTTSLNKIPVIGRPSTTYTIDGKKKDRDNNFVVSSGLTYSGIENTQLRASFAQGYVYPTLSHLYAVTSASTQTLYGNSNLKPEKSNNYEIGLRYNNNTWLVDSAIYYSAAKNYITEMSCNGSAICDGASGANFNYYNNANKANTHGLEFSIEYLDLAFIPYVKGNYLRRQIKTERYTTYDSGNPRFMGNAGIKHTAYLDWFDIDSDLFMRFSTKATRRSDSSVYRYSGWSTLNLSTTTSFGTNRQYRIGLDINNILNKNYTTAYETIPAAKFHALLSASMKF